MKKVTMEKSSSEKSSSVVSKGIFVLLFVVFFFIVISIIADQNSWHWNEVTTETDRYGLYEGRTNNNYIQVFNYENRTKVNFTVWGFDSSGYEYYEIYMEDDELDCSSNAISILEKLAKQGAFKKKTGCPLKIKTTIENILNLQPLPPETCLLTKHGNKCEEALKN